ncbi:DUF4422 domain-containing protein [Ligilactobacillus equi]
MGKILVVTHKDFDDTIVRNNSNNYKVIKVGNSLDDDTVAKKGWLTDSKGDNISSSNPYYCETTAQYWLWKNTKSRDYTGISHYRRYFLDPYKRNLNILTKESTDRILSKYDVILLYPEYKPVEAIIPSKEKKLKDQEKNFYVIRRVIREHYPEFLENYDRLIYGKKMIWRNMFVTSRKNYDEYCKFLFNVLKKYDEEMDELGYERAKRIDGFESEYLMPTWFLTKCEKIYYAECISLEEVKEQSIVKRFYYNNRHSFHNIYLGLKRMMKGSIK